MVKYGTDKADRTAFTKNLSVTGLFIKTNNVLKPGTTIQVELKFPERTFTCGPGWSGPRRFPPSWPTCWSAAWGFTSSIRPEDWADYFTSWESESLSLRSPRPSSWRTKSESRANPCKVLWQRALRL